MDHNIEAYVEEVQESFTSSSNRKKKRCEAWDFYEKLPRDINEDNRLRAKCKTCGLVLLADSTSGTSNLTRHHSKHQKKATSQGTPVDHEQYREKIARAIVRHNYPFNFVEHQGIRDIHVFLNPSVKTLSRNTAKTDVIKLYENHKETVKDELASIPSRICLTSDLWTSITSDGYMCVTAHYVDTNWILQKRILIFRHVPPPHSGPILGPKLINMLTEWEIEKKIFSITLDNAFYNEGIVDRLIEHFKLMDSLLSDGKFVHIRCANHILNLVVKAGLKTIETSICNIRESIKYVKGSEARNINFVECIKNLGLKLNGKVRQDVLTRWNSTFLMLNSAIPYRRAFFDFKVLDAEFRCCPSEEDCVKAKRIATFLKPFYKVTTLFSENYYPTANVYFHKIWKIHMMIIEEKHSQDLNIKAMAMEMETKFQKYWQEDYSPIASMAVVLDPRYKLKLVKFCFTKLDPLTCNEKVKAVEDNMHALFKEYLKNSIIDVDMMESSRGRGDVEMVDEMVDDMEEYDIFESQSELGLEKTQLDSYLQEPMLVRKGNEDLDVLKFWRDNRIKYPKLSLMTRDLLSIPITTVASDSSFSIEGRVIGKYQSSILSENAEAKLCSRDWLYGHQASVDSEEEDDIAIDVDKIATKIFN